MSDLQQTIADMMLEACGKKHTFTTKELREFQQMILESFERYDLYGAVYDETEYTRIGEILFSLNKAMAAILVDRNKSLEDIYLPFQDENKIMEWLEHTLFDDENQLEPEQYFADEMDWSIKSLALIIAEYQQQLDLIINAERYYEKAHWNSHPATASRLAAPTRELINDLCEVWRAIRNNELGLPSKDKDASNPLTRFLVAGISHIVPHERRPENKQVINYLAKYLKPHHAKMDAYYAAQKKTFTHYEGGVEQYFVNLLESNDE